MVNQHGYTNRLWLRVHKLLDLSLWISVCFAHIAKLQIVYFLSDWQRQENVIDGMFQKLLHILTRPVGSRLLWWDLTSYANLDPIQIQECFQKHVDSLTEHLRLLSQTGIFCSPEGQQSNRLIIEGNSLVLILPKPDTWFKLGRLKKLSKLMPKIQNIKGPENTSKNVKS